MSHQSTWDTAVNTATIEFGELHPRQIEQLTRIIHDIHSVKSEISSLFEAVSGVEICRLCRGECCRTGCFHFTAIDLIAYLITGRELFIPGFDNGACPFLGDCGCMMDPVFRPYNCVTFVCERVDTGMDPLDQVRFLKLSETLLDLYRSIEELFANRFLSGILNNGTRFIEGRSQGILWSGHVDNK